MSDVVLFGHRGASRELPENTMEAFERAVELGVNVIETDVHVTSDGHVVIHHDTTGSRMASIPREVATTSLEDIRQWNVGFGFRLPDGTGISDKSFRVPTLEQTLEAFPHMCFNIDIKPKDAVADVLRVIDRANAAGRVLLTSFHDAVVQSVRAAGYRGETGLSQGEAIRALALPSFAPKSLRPKGNRIQLPVEYVGLRFAKPGLVARLKKLGYAVDFWVVNDATEAKRVVASGCNGIMTDDPRAIATTLGRPVAPWPS